MPDRDMTDYEDEPPYRPNEAVLMQWGGAMDPTEVDDVSEDEDVDDDNDE